MTEAEIRLAAWDRWERTHNRDNYGRADAFKAGYEARDAEVRKLREALEEVWEEVDVCVCSKHQQETGEHVPYCPYPKVHKALTHGGRDE